MSKNSEVLTGQQLVADYQSTLLAIATAQAAQYEAKRSEEDLLNTLATSSGGGYLNPTVMNEDLAKNAAMASLDTHIKKIQAEQIKSMSNLQLEDISSKDKNAYVGKKVSVEVIDKEFQPIEAMWFDQRKGYTNSIFKTKRIEGSIEEVLMDKNALIIKPKLLRRLFVSDMKFFVVYVINHNTLKPAVEIKIL